MPNRPLSRWVGNVFLREEENGVSAYDQELDVYLFWEDVNPDDLKPCATREELYLSLQAQHRRPSLRLRYRYPARINWMITHACNLNCVYCIAQNIMEQTRDRAEAVPTAEHILSLHPLTVALSGGEPLLCGDLPMILRLMSGKTALILDSNGTVPFQPRHLQALRQANAVVRISLDGATAETSLRQRPFRSGETDPREIIERNLSLLIREKIPVTVHTVVTKINIDEMNAIGEILRKLGVPRWHLYGLIRNGRARECYPALHVDEEELSALRERMRKRFPELSVSSSPGERAADDTPTLIADSEGRFFLEKWNSTPTFIGADPTRPTAEEIAEGMNIESYIRNYYASAFAAWERIGKTEGGEKA